MKIKVGDIVLNEVTKSGKHKKQIAADVGISRNQLTNILAQQEMEMKYIVKIGKSIRHDFRSDIPQLATLITDHDVTPFETLNSGQLKDELLEMQRKYSSLQEEYIRALKDLLECQKTRIAVS